MARHPSRSRAFLCLPITPLPISTLLKGGGGGGILSPKLPTGARYYIYAPLWAGVWATFLALPKTLVMGWFWTSYGLVQKQPNSQQPETQLPSSFRTPYRHSDGPHFHITGMPGWDPFPGHRKREKSRREFIHTPDRESGHRGGREFWKNAPHAPVVVPQIQPTRSSRSTHPGARAVAIRALCPQ